MENNKHHTMRYIVAMLSEKSKSKGKHGFQSQSHGFHGSSVSSRNYALVCRDEGSCSGHCHGFRCLCFCTKLC
ncbi:hypothetical protein ACJRO7_001731 [Eucalyptus globulus]|uniref:Knottins-like domain-containing protein n=1 Tax=Eucalyptus globulus TaxID=34317 RepID=A0ABD3LRZ1_EUCGL